ncbi:MAG: AAA family ATPase [Chitinophagales bacterium]|nr:AAA family ATPase [Chitinophagales bacterium]
MNYFDFDGMRAYAAKSGTTYDASDPAAAWYYDTRDKLYYLIRLISEKLAMPLPVTYKEQPNAQKGRGKIVFKEYVLAGFAPEGFYPDGTLFIKVAFHNLTNQPYLSLEIDINAKAEDNPFEAQRDQILQATRTRIPVNDQFPKDWESLVQLIMPNVKALIPKYESIAAEVNPNTPNTSEKSTLGKNKAMKNSESRVSNALNTILYGPPGTGKTYRTVDHALAIISGGTQTVESIAADREKSNNDIKKRFDDLVKAGRIEFCTFHQSMAYEDFIEGIKPLPPEDGRPMQYDVKDGIFKRIANKANVQLGNFDEVIEEFKLKVMEAEEKVTEDSTKPENERKAKLITISTSRSSFEVIYRGGATFKVRVKDDLWHGVNISQIGRYHETGNLTGTYNHTYIRGIHKYLIENLGLKKGGEPLPYVLIIDEINRGNVSQIFGELITLLEDDKRDGAKNAISVVLPYSGDKFSVPPNLYIIGTMNTADRSVEALDTALRRRFSFVHMKPDPQKIAPAIVAGTSIDLQSMLKKINERLAVLIDADHTIGHAWLMGVEDLEGLKTVFRNKIIPLLQEFFYQDYEKIGLVLGDGFVEAKTVDSQKLFAALKNGSGLAEEYKDLKEFVIKPEADWDFTSI